MASTKATELAQLSRKLTDPNDSKSYKWNEENLAWDLVE